jgi:DNA polymerase-1
MSFDYSQIELRIAALLSQDPYFLKVFNDGKDVHAAVAMKVFGVKENEVTHEMRRRAKVINFGILYGMGVTALMQNLGTDRKEAQKFHDNYFEQFPTIKAYLDSVVEEAKKTGYTETLFGRKRYFPGLRSKIPFIRAMAERMAINAPIQGTATADIVKLAIVAIDKELKSKNLENKIHLVMQIHDELVYEVEDSTIEEAEGIIKKNMEQIIPKEFIKDRTTVPIIVSVNKAKNWGLIK